MSRVIRSPPPTKFKVKFCADMTLWTYFTKRVDYKRQIWKITFKVGSIVPSYTLQLRNNLQQNTLPICTAVYLSYCIQLHVCSLFDWANIASGKFAAHQQINLAPKGYVQYFAVEFYQDMQEIFSIFSKNFIIVICQIALAFVLPSMSNSFKIGRDSTCYRQRYVPSPVAIRI